MKRYLLTLFLIPILTLTVGLEQTGSSPPSTAIYLPFFPVPGTPAPTLNCRYGMFAFPPHLANFDITTLQAGLYMDGSVQLSPAGPAQSEYVQMIRLSQDRGGSDVCGPDYGYSVSPPLTESGLGRYVRENPGALWIVGNEPDRRTVQDDICPQQYAQAYHDVYYFIKDRDPTAQVAIAGLVTVTPARLQYLDIVWDTYRERYGGPMPVDVWTFHTYVLSETGEGDAHIALGTDPDLAIPYSPNCTDSNSLCHAEHDDLNLFIGQVVQMREWMAAHGQQDKPLLLTEFGILKPYHYPTPENPQGMCYVTDCRGDFSEWEYCFCDENSETFHPQRVADFMAATFDYLRTARDPQLGYPADDYRLVQQWAWYSLSTYSPWDTGHASNLIDPQNGYGLTVQGERWRSYVNGLSPAANLVAHRASNTATFLPPGRSTVTATISLSVLNNGDIPPGQNVAVMFYSDPDLTTPIGLATLPNLPGCARQEITVRTAWPNLTLGEHPFWAKVDYANLIAEGDETDNTASGIVRIYPYGTYLPIAQSPSHPVTQ